MNRRDALKAIGAGILGAVVPKVTKPVPDVIEPEHNAAYWQQEAEFSKESFQWWFWEAQNRQERIEELEQERKAWVEAYKRVCRDWADLVVKEAFPRADETGGYIRVSHALELEDLPDAEFTLDYDIVKANGWKWGDNAQEIEIEWGVHEATDA